MKRKRNKMFYLNMILTIVGMLFVGFLYTRVVGFFSFDPAELEAEKIRLENLRVEEYDYGITVYKPTVEQAIEEKNPELCLSLRGYVYHKGWDWEGDTSIRRMYKNDCIFEYIKKNPNPSACSLMVESSFGENRSRMPDPKNQCLNNVYGRLARDTDDEKYCELQQGINEWEGDRCYDRIAEVKKDVDLCKKITYKNGQINCEATVSLDPDVCYKLEKYENDTSIYSRGVGYCLGDIVRRTKDPTLCLVIDSPDYGEQWRVMRNQCVENAESYPQGEKHKEIKGLCHLMVEDELGFQYLERCEANYFKFYYE